MKVVVATVLMVFALGSAPGTTDDPGRVEATSPGLVSTSPADGRAAKILGHLEDGSTYGYWYGDTPETARPDYTRVKLDGGSIGYLRVEEVWPAEDPAMFESSDAGRALRAENMAKQIQPNDKGEVWAPAYDSDGRTVIGTVLVYTVDDEPPEQRAVVR